MCRTSRLRRWRSRRTGLRPMARRPDSPWRRSMTVHGSRTRVAMRTGRNRVAGRLAVLAVAGLAACSSTKGPKVADQPTLKNLEGRQVAIAPDQGIEKREDKAALAYKDFLKAAPRDPHRQEALRRLGDLEMDRVDAQAGGESNNNPSIDYAAAIKQYQEFLKTYPNDPGNDRVYYQLSRAYELSGQLEPALRTLDKLVQDFPRSRYIDEAQFRRGEVLFTLRDYANAERAYATTMKS